MQSDNAPETLRLRHGNLDLVLAPRVGGSIASFAAGAQQLLRPASAAAIAACDPLGMGCFPLVPFCGRIAHGRFRFQGRQVQLPPNFGREPHSIHGFGWQQPWTVVEQNSRRARLRYQHTDGAWPWRFAAEQLFELGADSLGVDLALTNQSTQPMPAGLGLHPYFPCDGRTVLSVRLAGEWQTAPDGLTAGLVMADGVRDWWAGAPVAARPVDNVYVGRQGGMTIRWPGQPCALTLDADATLGHTVVFVPPGQNYFCAEPISHVPDAVNREEPASVAGLVILAPGATLTARARFLVRADQAVS